MNEQHVIVNNHSPKSKKLPILLTLLCVLLIISGVVTYQFINKPLPAIREINWKSTRTQIKQKERAVLELDKPESLIYRDTLLDAIPAAIGYYFEDEKLISIKYVSMNRYQEFRGCLAEFQVMQDQIYQQYGRPETVIDEQFREAAWNAPDSYILLKIIETTDQKFLWILEFQPQE